MVVVGVDRCDLETATGNRADDDLGEGCLTCPTFAGGNRDDAHLGALLPLPLLLEYAPRPIGSSIIVYTYNYVHRKIAVLMPVSVVLEYRHMDQHENRTDADAVAGVPSYADVSRDPAPTRACHVQSGSYPAAMK